VKAGSAEDADASEHCRDGESRSRNAGRGSARVNDGSARNAGKHGTPAVHWNPLRTVRPAPAHAVSRPARRTGVR
jgi:hypothetical protein